MQNVNVELIKEIVDLIRIKPTRLGYGGGVAQVELNGWRDCVFFTRTNELEESTTRDRDAVNRMSAIVRFYHDFRECTTPDWIIKSALNERLARELAQQ
jgi:hypothetical protein